MQKYRADISYGTFVSRGVVCSLKEAFQFKISHWCSPLLVTHRGWRLQLTRCEWTEISCLRNREAAGKEQQQTGRSHPKLETAQTKLPQTHKAEGAQQAEERRWEI